MSKRQTPASPENLDSSDSTLLDQSYTSTDPTSPVKRGRMNPSSPASPMSPAPEGAIPSLLNGVKFVKKDDRVPDDRMELVKALVNQITDDIKSFGEAHNGLLSMSEEIKEICAAIKYVGLDVVGMRRALVYYAMQMDKDYFQRPLIKAICIGLVRGNNIERMKENTSPEVRSMVDELVSGLKIKSRVERSPINITFARIMVCFPELTAMVAKVSEAQGVVADVPSDYPHCMRNGSFASLIPRIPRDNHFDEDKRDLAFLVDAHVMYQTKTSMVLDRKIKKIDFALIERQRIFVNTGMLQATSNDEARWDFITQSAYGIYDKGVLNPAIIVMANQLAKYNTV